MSSRFTKLLAVAAVLFVSATALYSYTPQTILVDGVNDFLVDNLVESDGLDAQFIEIDMDSVYVTNDANKLFFGIDYSKGGWSSNQIGVHISTGDLTGGTTDSWGRAIAWNTATRKPDFQAYVNLDNSWQELREWNSGGSTWDVVYDGIGSLGWVNNSGFEELPLNLSDLGLSLGDTIYYEIVITQDGSTKGPLDALANDGLQLSTPSSTTWDVGAPVELVDMQMYVIQNTGDSDPPTVSSAKAVIGADLESCNQIEVTFSEPVDETTAENTGNYTLSGTGATINTAVRNPSFPSRVMLTLNAGISPQSAFYSVEVTGVQDLNSNTIVDDNTTNVSCFFLKGLRFEADMSYHFMTHSFPTDTVSVEGGLAPLTWGVCDNALMTDIGADVFVDEVYFSIPGTGCGTGSPSASANLEWKLMHQCSEYETISNRQHTLTHSTGAWDTLSVFWDDNDPSQFTTGPVDVIFTVDATSMSPTADSTLAINGSQLPLSFDIPSINEMADDGVFPDLAAGDGIYATLIRFPAMSQKNVGYKFVYEDRYECQAEGNREVYLNEAAYDTLGGAKGALVMPRQYFDRCSTSGRDVEVIFRVNMHRNLGSADTVAVNGNPNNQTPEVINWNVPSINPMRDDGVFPDFVANDHIYATSIIFPDSSSKYQEFKYLFNSAYECTTSGNRSFWIDDAYDAVGHPQILSVGDWSYCGVTGVDDTPTPAGLALHQNYPNPFNPTTTISFSANERGRAVLRIYDVRGALVTTLLDEVVDLGERQVRWEGRDRFGREMASGVYFYDLRLNGQRATRKMVMIR
jgi:hypothetical protein